MQERIVVAGRRVAWIEFSQRIEAAARRSFLAGLPPQREPVHMDQRLLRELQLKLLDPSV